MSGFVYLWFDRKHKRYYLGKHWGTLDDGYVCSSRWMKAAQIRRPQDFKRRILEWVHTEKKELTAAEKRWGLMIKKEEFGKRYYNLHPPGGNLWHDDPLQGLKIREKISIKTKEAMANPAVRKKIVDSPNRIENIRKANTGKRHTAEVKEKISDKTKRGMAQSDARERYLKGLANRKLNRDYTDPVFREKMRQAALNRSTETRKKISENSRRLHAEGRIGRKKRGQLPTK